MLTFTEEVLNGKVHFVLWFVQVNRQETTVKKQITFFYKKVMLILYSHFLKKTFAICRFFTACCLDKRFWNFFILFLWSSVNSIGIFFFAGRKRVDLVVIFNKGRKETFAVSLQNRRSCFCIKYLTLARPRKLIVVKFTFLYSM